MNIHVTWTLNTMTVAYGAIVKHYAPYTLWKR